MRLRYPLLPEDVAKFFDKAFDKVIEATEPVRQLAKGVTELSQNLANLTKTVGIIAHNQMVHHQMITKMWGMQQYIISKLQESSLNTRLPEIDLAAPPPGTSPEEQAKADARKKAAMKPN